MTTTTATATHTIRKGHGIVDLLIDGTIVATAIRHFKSRGHAESGWVITLALDVEAAHRGGSLTGSTAVYLNQRQLIARLERFATEYLNRTQIDDGAYGENLTADQFRALAANNPAEFVYRALSSFRPGEARIREEIRRVADEMVLRGTAGSAPEQIAFIGRLHGGHAERLCSLIARTIDDAADARATAERAAARPIGIEVAAGELRREVKANGPVEIETPDGWMPYVTTHAGRYHCTVTGRGRCTVTVMTATGEIGLDMREDTPLRVRTAQTAVVAPRHVPPAAGESRVVRGSWLRRYVGWEWLTPEGNWEFVTAARGNDWGRWLITTTSTTPGREWCEPEDGVAVIRPASGPVEIVKQRNIADDCDCEFWRAEPWTPQSVLEDTDFARYPVADCAHHTLPAGRAVAVAGGVPVSPADAKVLTDADVAAPERVDVGRVVRTWIRPDQGRRWYEIAMVLTGETVNRPDADLSATPDPGWDFPASNGTDFPVIYEVQVLDPDGSWVHEAAGFAPAGDVDSYLPRDLHLLAEDIAAGFAEKTRRHVRASVIPAKEEYRYNAPGHIGYAIAEPALLRRALTRR